MLAVDGASRRELASCQACRDVVEILPLHATEVAEIWRRRNAMLDCSGANELPMKEMELVFLASRRKSGGDGEWDDPDSLIEDELDDLDEYEDDEEDEEEDDIFDDEDDLFDEDEEDEVDAEEDDFDRDQSLDEYEEEEEERSDDEDDWNS
jgi:hypothetical protein